VLSDLAWLEGMVLCKYAEGERLIEKAVEVINKIPTERLTGATSREELVAECHKNLGVFAFQLGHVQVAEDLLSKVLCHYEKSGKRREVANALSNVGQVYYQKGEFDRALDCQMKALCIFEQTGDRGGALAALCNIGNVHYQNGEMDRALEFYQKYLKAGELMGDRACVANAWGNIGLVCQEKGALDQALEFFNKQLELSGQMRKKDVMARASSCIGNVHRLRAETLAKDGKSEESQREWLEVLEWGDRCLKLAGEIGHGELTATGHGGIGNALWAIGDKSRGMEELKLALAKYDELGMKSKLVDDLRAKIKEREGQ
jgi:tetratricopeptide (TPR) repeat protein